jgi:ribosome biogenesis protein MAK21
MNAQDAVSDRFYGALYQSLLHPGLARSSALSQFLGLVFQAVKADVSAKRAASFLKRLLQVTIMLPANVACGALVVASEMLKHKPTLWPAFTQAEDSFAVEGRDVLEHSDSERSDRDDDNHSAKATLGGTAPCMWGSMEWPPADYYDMWKRAPLHARAERACAWEVLPLASHAHPSVATMAQTLLAGTNIVYDGDPLEDLTLLAFLDKFVKRCASPVVMHATKSGLLIPLLAWRVRTKCSCGRSIQFATIIGLLIARLLAVPLIEMQMLHHLTSRDEKKSSSSSART